MAKKYQYQLEIMDSDGNNCFSFDLKSEFDNLNILIVASAPFESERRNIMKKICDLVYFNKENPMSSDCKAIFSLHRIDNDPPVLIPSDLSNEILDFLLK